MNQEHIESLEELGNHPWPENEEDMPPQDEEGDAWRLLCANGYKDIGGMICHDDPNHIETPEECKAINYLCSEWDYGFLPYGETLEENRKRLFPNET